MSKGEALAQGAHATGGEEKGARALMPAPRNLQAPSISGSPPPTRNTRYTHCNLREPPALKRGMPFAPVMSRGGALKDFRSDVPQ